MNESLPHCVSPVYSSPFLTSSPTHPPFFFLARIIANSNLLYFITATPLAVPLANAEPPKYHMYENQASTRQQIRHRSCTAAGGGSHHGAPRWGPEGGMEWRRGRRCPHLSPSLAAINADVAVLSLLDGPLLQKLII